MCGVTSVYRLCANPFSHPSLAETFLTPHIPLRGDEPDASASRSAGGAREPEIVTPFTPHTGIKLRAAAPGA